MAERSKLHGARFLLPGQLALKSNLVLDLGVRWEAKLTPG
jgi:hypothetical protein